MSFSTCGSVRRSALLVALVFLAFAIAAYGKEPKIDVRNIFRQSDFIPHVPTVAALKRDFPKGSLMACEGEGALVFRAAPDRWILFHFDSELSEQHSGVTEIEYINWAPTSSVEKQVQQDGLRVLSLGDFHIGDSARKVAESGRNFRIKNARKYGKSVRIYEFNPHPEETDLYAQVFVQAGVVVGFSLGVTE